MTKAEALQLARTEAMRILPGLVAAREHSAPVDATILLEEFRAVVLELGLSLEDGYSQLFGAAVYCLHDLIGDLAVATETPRQRVIENYAARAVTWASQAEGVGGH